MGKDAGLERMNAARAELEKDSVARARALQMLDGQSFTEIDAFARDSAVVTGFGLVDERPVYVVAQDPSVLGGSLGQETARKVRKTLALAEKTGAPVVYLLDSEGVRLTEGAGALTAYAQMMADMAALSGVVPQIAVALGRCIGGVAVMAAQADVCIASDKALMLAASPQIMSAVAGKTLTPADVGSAAQAVASGLAHLAVPSEAAAFSAARALIGMLPSNSAEDAPMDGPADDWNRVIPELNAGRDADVRDTLRRIADGGIIHELQATYATGMVTALCRLGGRTVGLLANQITGHEDGLCACACDKGARFVQLCDCFNIPLVSFVDAQGLKTPGPGGNADAVKGIARLTSAMAGASVPKVSLVLSQAVGLAFVAMGARGLGADLCYAWPDAVIAPLSAEAMAQALHADQIALPDPIASREALAEQYAKDAANPIIAAQNGDIDDVIEPASTRVQLIAALEMLMSKRSALPARKQANLAL